MMGQAGGLHILIMVEDVAIYLCIIVGQGGVNCIYIIVGKMEAFIYVF
jgi:hypothetical protein